MTAPKSASKPKDAAKALRDCMGGDRDDSGNLFDVIPSYHFGKGKARILRKMVLLAIAKSANADGSSAYPSRETIAHRCLVSVEAVRRVLKWLEANGLLKIETKAAPVRNKHGKTNLYTILFPDPATPATENEQQQIEVVSAPGEAPATVETSISNNSQEHQQQLAGAPATTEITPANESCYYRPLDRPLLNRPVDRPSNRPENSNGWLAGRFTELLYFKTGKSFVMSKHESVGLAELQVEHCDLDLLLGFYRFLERPKGLGGLAMPVTKFLSDEAETCITHARQDAHKGEIYQGYKDTVKQIGLEFGLNLTELQVRSLCQLGFAHSWLSSEDDDLSSAAIRNYLQEHSGLNEFDAESESSDSLDGVRA
jgi:hypothetical protein